MAEFKVGDRVRLTQQYDYLAAGELGTVTEVDVYGGMFPARVKFDHEKFTPEDAEFASIFPDWGVGWLVDEQEVELV